MQLGLFLDLDGTVRESTDGKFILSPRGQRIMTGVHEAIAFHKAQGYTIIGITNQGGCDTINRDTGKPLKSLEDAIAEQKYTLKLIPQLSAIYFCPDMNGQVCWIVKKNGVEFLVSDLDTRVSEFENRILTGSEVYRKPGAGMIYRAVKDFDIDLTKSWMIGDRPEDEGAAIAAGINFMDAETWRMRFTPGIYEIRQATQSQLEFLEGINLN